MKYTNQNTKQNQTLQAHAGAR